MKMRLRLWLLIAAVLLIAVVVTAVLLPSRPRPCRKTYEQVHVGMTREEVETTVGGPPGDYADGKIWLHWFSAKFFGYKGWYGPDAELRVLFDAEGHAIDVVVLDGDRWLIPPKPGIREWVRDRLGL
ncbi:hypothetical protein [Fimbriiglobus ruber]|uniref:Uncharacterized protein n=1 Tax=Fimbriiglobus ruber TaxID=1908690 RepID=A0A225DLK6_9BACT|nr:hypothetical protein [Fimbriiglobus ruber]OWK38366.1 hypothetical protein FRUB_07486 [Fimbriiglobus ruber]